MTLASVTLDGRVALVTGSGRADGIGAAIARRMAAAGAAVAVCDLGPPAGGNEPPEGLAAVLKEVRQSGVRAAALVGDVSSEAEAERMVEECRVQLGGCDILVNNAAAPHGADRADIEDMPVEAWDEQMAVNARGCFLMARAALASMRSRKWGRIINIASIAGHRGVRHRAPYSASKAAILGFTRALAIDVAAEGITVNAICPGLILTSRNAGTDAGPTSWDMTRALYSRAPAGRAGVPDDIAGPALFLASDLASYVTGQFLDVDGGLGSVVGSVPVEHDSTSAR